MIDLAITFRSDSIAELIGYIDSDMTEFKDE